MLSPSPSLSPLSWFLSHRHGRCFVSRTPRQRRWVWTRKSPLCHSAPSCQTIHAVVDGFFFKKKEIPKSLWLKDDCWLANYKSAPRLLLFWAKGVFTRHSHTENKREAQPWKSASKVFDSELCPFVSAPWSTFAFIFSWWVRNRKKRSLLKWTL